MERKLAAILAADVVGYSRLMEADEEATARTLSEYRDIIEDLIASHRGRVFGGAGDSVIAEFASPVEAVRCAVDIQRKIEIQNADLAVDQRMRLRIGVNLGDVMVDGDNLLGDGVNIAARLESLADAGGICVSQSVYDAVSSSLPFSYASMGDQAVKNIEKPVRVYRVIPAEDATAGVTAQPASGVRDEQEIRFCTASDGVGIAYTTVGEGPPMVKAANWLNHLEFDWQSPIWRHLFSELSRDHQLVRYDERGNGLSDWEVDEFPLRHSCAISKRWSTRRGWTGSRCSACRREAPYR